MLTKKEEPKLPFLFYARRTLLTGRPARAPVVPAGPPVVARLSCRPFGLSLLPAPWRQSPRCWGLGRRDTGRNQQSCCGQ
jgi:hypothetical protein